MKIYARTHKAPQNELESYLYKLCNKDYWLAVREAEMYNKWIKCAEVDGKILYASIYNTAWYPKKDVLYRVPDMEAKTINLDKCKVVHPITTLTSEELAEYISSPDTVYTFDIDEDYE